MLNMTSGMHLQCQVEKIQHSNIKQLKDLVVVLNKYIYLELCKVVRKESPMHNTVIL